MTAHLTKMSPQHEEKMRHALKAISEAKSIAGNYGVVDFTYSDFLEYTDRSIRNKSYVSHFLRTLELQGKISRIRKGSHIGPSRWDVRGFIASPAPEELVFSEDSEVVEVVEPQAPKTTEDPIGSLKESVKDMTEYLRELHAQMITHLEGLASDLELPDKANVEALQKEYDKVKQEAAELAKKLSELEKQRSELTFELKVKEKELEQQTGVAINKNAVVRYKNLIMDEVERFLDVKDWRRKNMDQHFRVSVNEKLDNLLKEVGIS